jgi:hypothetical protein
LDILAGALRNRPKRRNDDREKKDDGDYSNFALFRADEQNGKGNWITMNTI